MKNTRDLGWINKPLEVCEHENKIFECQQCIDLGYERKVIFARSYAAGIGSPFVLVCSTYRAGYDAGYADAKEEMSYDVHTCHHNCFRLMCVQRRKIDELNRKLTIATDALEELRSVKVANEINNWYPAHEALNKINNLQI